MDIEGAEHAVFLNADTADLRRIDRFAIEYHDNIAPGTGDMLRARFVATHELTMNPDGPGYGVLLGKRRAREEAGVRDSR